MRKDLDCRDQPSETRCPLRLSGTEAELLDAAYDHPVKPHRGKPSSERRARLRGALEDEDEGARSAGRHCAAEPVSRA